MVLHFLLQGVTLARWATACELHRCEYARRDHTGSAIMVHSNWELGSCCQYSVCLCVYMEHVGQNM